MDLTKTLQMTIMIASETRKPLSKTQTMRGGQLAHPSAGEEVVISGMSRWHFTSFYFFFTLTVVHLNNVQCGN